MISPRPIQSLTVPVQKAQTKKPTNKAMALDLGYLFGAGLRLQPRNEKSGADQKTEVKAFRW
jgi:hypothetical protein